VSGKRIALILLDPQPNAQIALKSHVRLASPLFQIGSSSPPFETFAYHRYRQTSRKLEEVLISLDTSRAAVQQSEIGRLMESIAGLSVVQIPQDA
jgi:hypothetical protein